MKKIAVVTGTRAEYGLLKPLIKALHNDSSIKLQLLVTAMHLSREYGMTVNEIINDGFPISRKIECLLNSDSAMGVSKSIAFALSSFAEAFEKERPDIVVVLGDRTEMLAVTIASNMANIPIAHIHGGETTEGAYDEGIRHAISKMSYWHFTSSADYQKRVIQLGESPERVFNVGAIGLDSIKSIKLLSKKELEEKINFSLGEKSVIVTYHPVTLENSSSEKQFSAILNALESLPHLKIIFTHANSDKESKIINSMIKRFSNANPEISCEFKSLGQLRYLSSLKYVDAVIGNSSSGIIEVPYFKIPTVNIGDRQKGRVAPKSVINCAPNTLEIKKALKKAFSDEFKKEIQSQDQLYGSGDTTPKIITELKKEQTVNLKKSFFDINFTL